jgi:hypothetical protein
MFPNGITTPPAMASGNPCRHMEAVKERSKPFSSPLDLLHRQALTDTRHPWLERTVPDADQAVAVRIASGAATRSDMTLCNGRAKSSLLSRYRHIMSK